MIPDVIYITYYITCILLYHMYVILHVYIILHVYYITCNIIYINSGIDGTNRKSSTPTGWLMLEHCPRFRLRKFWIFKIKKHSFSLIKYVVIYWYSLIRTIIAEKSFQASKWYHQLININKVSHHEQDLDQNTEIKFFWIFSLLCNRENSSLTCCVLKSSISVLYLRIFDNQRKLTFRC